MLPRNSAWLVALLFVGCGTTVTGGDASPPDADGGADATSDATSPDGALPDGALPDGALPDGALPDGALPDGAPPDTSAPDTGSDAGADTSIDATADASDGASPDAAPPPGTTICARRFTNATGAATGVAVDSLGNVVVTGNFNGSIDFGGGALVAPGEGPNIFVVKLDAACNHVWSKRFGSDATQRATSVAVDAAGNVFVTGRIQGNVDFGGGPLPGAFGEVFLVKLDPTGAHLWSRHFGAGEGQGVATDSAGNVALVGASNGVIDFGGGPLAGAGISLRVIMAKLGPTGAHLWSERFSAAVGNGAGIATDPAGATFAVGYFANGTLDLGGTPLVNTAGNVDGFLAIRDAAGAHTFSRSFTDTMARDLVEIASGVATMPSGDLAVSGRFMGTIDFGGGPTSVVGFSDTFVARYSANGAYVWAKRFGTSNETHPGGIATDPTNHVLVTGSLKGSADFGAGVFTSAGGSDAFVVKLDPAGAPVWSKRFGDGANQAGAGVATDASGHVFVVGRTEGTTDFGAGPVTGSGVFVVKLAP